VKTDANDSTVGRTMNISPMTSLQKLIFEAKDTLNSQRIC